MKGNIDNNDLLESNDFSQRVDGLLNLLKEFKKHKNNADRAQACAKDFANGFNRMYDLYKIDHNTLQKIIRNNVGLVSKLAMMLPDNGSQNSLQNKFLEKSQIFGKAEVENEEQKKIKRENNKQKILSSTKIYNKYHKIPYKIWESIHSFADEQLIATDRMHKQDVERFTV